jgi:hypothetical protein
MSSLRLDTQWAGHRALAAQVKEGEVGVAISASGNISNLIRRVDGGQHQSRRSISTFPTLLIIRNESLSGLSRVVVHSIDVLRAN